MFVYFFTDQGKMGKTEIQNRNKFKKKITQLKWLKYEKRSYKNEMSQTLVSMHAENDFTLWKTEIMFGLCLRGSNCPTKFKARWLLQTITSAIKPNLSFLVSPWFTWFRISIKLHQIATSILELVSKELNHLAAILHVYAGGLNFMK